MQWHQTLAANLCEQAANDAMYLWAIKLVSGGTT